MKVIKWFFLFLLLAILLGGGAAAWILFGSSATNPHDYARVGNIPAPWGYHRVMPNDGGYAEYLRSLPLKEKGSKVEYYTRGESHFQSLAYAVVDLPILSNDEQCADVCMRLRAEYLYGTGRAGQICFQNVNGQQMRFGGGGRKAFEQYMRRVYGTCSTYSLKRSMSHRELCDMQPGDVFVYAAGDHDLDRKLHSPYGHAIMVVDVAETKDGRKAFLLAEGSTPARSIHILRNWKNPLWSPWFFLDEDAEHLFFDCFYFKGNELRHF